VVDGVSLLDVCVKTEDHVLPFTGPKKISPIVLIHRKNSIKASRIRGRSLDTPKHEI
jgi:hypothetical protein